MAILCSSLSVDSNTRILYRHACAHARAQRLDAEFIDLRDHRVLPYGEEGSEGVEYIEEKLGGAGGIVIGFPLYNYNMNASLKALIERCGACFEDKVVGIMAAAGGHSSYMSVLSIAQSLMLDFRSWIVPRYVYATRAAFGAGSIADAGVCRRVEQLVDAVHRAAWQHRMPLPTEGQEFTA